MNKPVMGVNYKIALPFDQWDKARKFLRLLAVAKRQVAQGKKPEVDLKKIREVFAML